ATVEAYAPAGPSASSSSTLQVADPAVQATAAAGPFHATEGQTSSVQALAIFTDPGGPESLSEYRVQVDWGDGNGFTSDANVTLSGPNGSGVFSVSGCHRYAEEDGLTGQVKIKVLHGSTLSNSVS